MPLLSPAEYDAASRLAPVALDLALRSLVILSMAGVAALLLRRASAAARHWVWLLGMAGTLSLPVVWAIVPGWHLLPRVFNEPPPASATGTIVEGPALPAGLDLLPKPEPITIAEEPRPAAGTVIPPPQPPVATEAPTTAAPKVAAAALVPTPAPAAVPPKAAPPKFRLTDIPWPAWILLAWLAGALLVLGYVLLGNISLWWLRRRCTRIAQGELADMLTHLRGVMEVRRPVILLATESRTMPMTWGLFRTRLLLPAQAAHWPMEQRRAVLMHELGHVKRWDCLTQFVAQLACAVYWFNPLIWVAWHRMQVERERACDDLVLSAGARASTYAEHLLQTASSLPPMRFISAAAIAMARPSALEERLRAILDTHRNRRRLEARGVTATALLLALFLVPVAALRAQQTPPAPTVGAVPAASTSPATTPATASAATGRAGRGATPGGTPRVSEGPSSRLDTIIYEIRMPPANITQIDTEALTKVAGDPAAFEKALSALGKSRPTHRVNQDIRLGQEFYTQLGASVPYITNSQISNTGQTINSVAYTNVGAIVDLIPNLGTGGRISLDVSIQVSALIEGGVRISEKVTAPTFTVCQMQQSATLQPGQPFVFMGANGVTLDVDGNAIVYISRVIFGPVVTDLP